MPCRRLYAGRYALLIFHAAMLAMLFHYFAMLDAMAADAAYDMVTRRYAFAISPLFFSCRCIIFAMLPPLRYAALYDFMP